MNWLEKAWITTILGFITELIDHLYDRLYPDNYIILGFFLVLGIVPIITAWYFIYKDAEQRKISKAHGTWSLLGIIGVAIYYFFFAKKHKIKKL